MTRPIPPHGTEGRYKGTRAGRPGCRCDICTRGNRLAGTRRARARLNGQSHRVDRQPVVDHLHTLKASRMSQTGIARAAGVSQAAISYILSGRISTCRRETAERILAVRPGRVDYITDQPALPYTRRVRALYATGHGRLAITTDSGLHESTISHVANGRYRTVEGRVAAAIRDTYDRLSTRPGTTAKARGRAAAKGWHDVAYWEDTGRIDDLDFDPEARDLRIAAVAEDARWLIASGLDRDQAAARLGLSRRYIDRALTEVAEETAA